MLTHHPTLIPALGEILILIFSCRNQSIIQELATTQKQCWGREGHLETEILPQEKKCLVFQKWQGVPSSDETLWNRRNGLNPKLRDWGLISANDKNATSSLVAVKNSTEGLLLRE